jgi:hypothetical protein
MICIFSRRTQRSVFQICVGPETYAFNVIYFIISILLLYVVILFINKYLDLLWGHRESNQVNGLKDRTLH